MLDPQHTTDPATNRAVLEHRLREIDKRLAELEVILEPFARQVPRFEPTAQQQELLVEQRELQRTRGEIDRILRKPKPDNPKKLEEKRKRDLASLRFLVRERKEILLAQIARWEKQGDYANARGYRLQLPLIVEQVCDEYGIPKTLIAELEEPSPPAKANVAEVKRRERVVFP